MRNIVYGEDRTGKQAVGSVEVASEAERSTRSKHGTPFVPAASITDLPIGTTGEYIPFARRADVKPR